MLRDRIVDLVQEGLGRPISPLKSLLFIRDGQVCGQEDHALDETVQRLQEVGALIEAARVDVVEMHKDTLKSLRLWEVDSDETVTNPLEGEGVILDARTVLLAGTGAATLHQGTAEPYLIVGNGRCESVIDAATASFLGAQLNWSNPRVAQRMHVALKRTDEELKARAAREIRRLR
jgi:hypothetical protein